MYSLGVEGEDVKKVIDGLRIDYYSRSIIVGLITISFLLSYISSLVFSGDDILKMLPLLTLLY